MSMQTIYKCNRCGKARVAVEEQLPALWLNAGIIVGGANRDFHLCETCTKQLRAWLTTCVPPQTD